MNRLDEISYPFMAEEGLFCDYEILSDGLSSYLGLTTSIAKEREYPVDICELLEWLTQSALHMNGSLRGEIAIYDDHLKRLHTLYDYYKDKSNITGFTLPTGSYLSSQLNIARYKTKELVRLLNKIHREQCRVPTILFSFSNLLANLLFVLSCYINDIDKVENIPFLSKSYF